MPHLWRSVSSAAAVSVDQERPWVNPVDLAKSILAQESGELPRTRRAATPPNYTSARSAALRYLQEGVDGISVLKSGPPKAPPGSAVEFRFALVNDEVHPVSCFLILSDFVSDSGGCIASTAATLPREAMRLAAKARFPITCHVKVPANIEYGIYDALLIAAPTESTPVALRIEVSAL